MPKIKRFFECLLPISICNLECPYCYIIQQNRRTMMSPRLEYSPKHIAYSLRQDRVGGISYFSLCGTGETMLQPEIIDLAYYLLEEGHYVNITTNGTCSKRFDDLIDKCNKYISRLHISFSFHYTELLRKNLLNEYFENIHKLRNAGVSVLFQMNLCDEYIERIDEILDLSIKRMGTYPQLAVTRKETNGHFQFFTKYSDDEYIEFGRRFNSPLFDFTIENFTKKRTEFCYAGDWSCTLNMQNGELKRCYDSNEKSYIFKDPESPIHFQAIGHNCKSPYCVNSSHFLSLGVIPKLSTPTYAKLRIREGQNWYSEEMKDFLNSKLSDTNKEYSYWRKLYIYKLCPFLNITKTNASRIKCKFKRTIQLLRRNKR